MRLVVDESETTKNSYTYDPTGIDFATEYTENTENPFKFTGQWFDSEIEQYYLRARMYDPELMRFTGYDPVKGSPKKSLTLHKYLYCLNNPLNRIDPKGESAIVLANAVLTGAALYNQGIRLACYAVSSGDDRFWDLAEITFDAINPAMAIALPNPLGPVARIAIWAGESVIDGVAADNVTGFSATESLAVDVGAYAAYYSAMLMTESFLGITAESMEAFMEWKWNW